MFAHISRRLWFIFLSLFIFSVHGFISVYRVDVGSTLQPPQSRDQRPIVHFLLIPGRFNRDQRLTQHVHQGEEGGRDFGVHLVSAVAQPAEQTLAFMGGRLGRGESQKPTRALDSVKRPIFSCAILSFLLRHSVYRWQVGTPTTPNDCKE